MSRAVDLLTDPADSLCYPLETWAALFWNTHKRLRRVDMPESGIREAVATLDDLALRCPYPAVARRSKTSLHSIFLLGTARAEGETPCR